MAQIGRPFKSLPVSKRGDNSFASSTEGTQALLASIRSAPIPGTGSKATPLPELAQQIADAEVLHPGDALQRLQTFQTVKQALRAVPQLEDEKQSFIARLATRLNTTIGGKETKKSASREQASAEVTVLMQLRRSRQIREKRDLICGQILACLYIAIHHLVC